MSYQLLIFDLDETLIYSTETPLWYSHDFMVGQYFVYKRPYVNEFIKTCNEHFELAVWSSATESYAEAIVTNVFPSEVKLSFLWARKKCVVKPNPHTNDYEWIKDLKKVKRRGYSLERIIVVDDSPEKLSRHYGNLLAVNPFNGNPEDDELKLLTRYLLQLTTVENIRRIEKRNWRHKV